jgi:predicted transposase YdaD
MGLHDSRVAHAFADVEHARGILATALPPAVAARVDFSSLRPEKGSFVDEHLQGRATDLLYSARSGGREGLVYLLWEHKSEPERLAPLQVLRYLPRLTLVLDDLWQQSDDELYARAATAFARLVLWALKHARGARGFAEEERWKELIATVLAEPDGVRALTALFRHITQVSPAATPERLRGLLPEGRGAEIEEAVMNWFQQGIADGERRGENRGRTEGRREGERAAEQRLVLKLLRLRFGELPAPAVARIDAAEVPELELWAERLVTASSLEDVLGPALGERLRPLTPPPPPTRSRSSQPHRWTRR